MWVIPYRASEKEGRLRNALSVLAIIGFAGVSPAQDEPVPVGTTDAGHINAAADALGVPVDVSTGSVTASANGTTLYFMNPGGDLDKQPDGETWFVSPEVEWKEELDFEPSDETFIKLNHECAVLGEPDAANLEAWAQCIVTLVHELNHVAFGDWVALQCLAEAEADHDTPAQVGQAYLDCQADYDALDACLRSADEDGENKLEEAWASYKAALCACISACALPPGPAKDAAIDAATGEFGEADDDWKARVDDLLSCQGELAGVGGSFPFPPLGGNDQTQPPFDGGPQFTACDCANQSSMAEVDPCSDPPPPTE